MRRKLISEFYQNDRRRTLLDRRIAGIRSHCERVSKLCAENRNHNIVAAVEAENARLDIIEGII